MKKQESITVVEQYVIDYVMKLRADKELTQQDIANIIGVSRSFIKEVESVNSPAKYNLRHINALADYFGMSPRLFLPEKAFPVDAVEEKVMKKKVAVKKASVKKPTKKSKK
jgi:transcriptional regulator with XRE-family HTH domain